MVRNLFTILDDLTANLAELKAALAPLTLIGGTIVAEANELARTPRPVSVKHLIPGRPASAKRRAAMRSQGQYMSAIRPLSAAHRAEVKKIRATSGVAAAIALAHKLRA